MHVASDTPTALGEGPIDDAEVFARLYRRHHRSLYRLCLLRTHDRELAEDIVHDVFEKAFAVRHRFDEDRRVWPWLASIATRECIDAYRRRSYAESRVGAVANGEQRELGDTTSNPVLDRLEQHHLVRHIATLPLRQRVALQLYALDGWSYGEIAVHFGDSVASVKSLILRARARLRDAVGGPWAAVLGAARTVQIRLAGLVERLPLAVSACGDVLRAGVEVLRSTPAAVLVLLTLLYGVTSPPSPPRRPTHDLPSSTAPVPPTPSPSADTGRPAERVDVAPRPRVTTVEPPTRPYAEAVERTVQQATAPLLEEPSPDSGDGAYGGYAVATSPGYEEEPTIFVADGFQGGFRSTPLLVSRDGGASWARPAATGLGSVRRLLLPPTHPRDRRVFVAGDRGLQVSRDDGESFVTLVRLPELTDAALSPHFDDGDPTMLLVAAGTLLRYHDDTGLVEPLVLDTLSRTEYVTSADYALDDRGELSIAVGTIDIEAGWQAGIAHRPVRLHRCTWPTTFSVDVISAGGPRPPQPACERTTLPGQPTSGIWALQSAGRARQGAMFLSTYFELYVSTDGGRTSRKVVFDVPTESEFYDVDVVPTATGLSAVVARSAGRWVDGTWVPAAPLLRTDDGGQTWIDLDVGLPGFSHAGAVAVTPTGRIVAVGLYGAGVACSADGGRTWAPTCPTPDTA